jgi:alanine dehydrogenase
MKIGIPKESKILEGRVGLVPQACADLVRGGHELILQQGAGLLSGYSDQQYQDLGVMIVASAADVYEQAELIIKVKEPCGDELQMLQSRHLLFCFLHLAANRELAVQLQAIGLTAIAFETVESHGSLPLLAPMSDIAGRVAAQVGAHLLHQPAGGRGILLGGLPAAERGHVVVIGAGVAGSNAAAMAAAMGAQVTVFDRKREKLQQARRIGDNVTGLYPYQDAIEETVQQADLLVGAVLIPGARTPQIVSRDMVKNMKKRSVIIDISVDQGGCVETIRPTDYQQPTYVDEEVIHFGVTNMPGAVPRSASQALSAAILPYALLLASANWRGQLELLNGINIEAGQVVHPVLKEALA